MTDIPSKLDENSESEEEVEDTELEEMEEMTEEEHKRLKKSLDELPDDLKRKIKPYNTKQAQAKKDYLNNVQRSFVKFYMRKIFDENKTKGESVADLIKMGCEEDIFNVKLKVKGKSLKQYLTGRVKYEHKRLKQNKSMKTLLKEKMKTEN